MSKKKIFLIIGLALLVAILGLYQFVVYQMTPIQHIIATDITVGADWQELQISPPQRAWRDSQHIILNVEEYERTIGGPFEIRLKDGMVVKPEVQIIDSKGNVLVLEDNMRLGNTIGFSPNGGFAEDARKYTQIRIRSDKPLKISKLSWLDMNLH